MERHTAQAPALREGHRNFRHSKFYLIIGTCYLNLHEFEAFICKALKDEAIVTML